MFKVIFLHCETIAKGQGSAVGGTCLWGQNTSGH